MSETNTPNALENVVRNEQCIETYVASHGTINTGFTFMGPFSSPEAALNNGYPHVQWEAIAAQSVGFTFLITDGQPGSTVYCAYARELNYGLSRTSALEQCAADWGRENTHGLTVLASFFGDIALKEISTCP